MKCGICESGEAVVHIHQVAGEDEIHLHLCEECAASKGVTSSGNPSEFSVSYLLTNPVDTNGTTGKLQSKKVCPQCGMTLKELKIKTRVGCNECFSTFAAEIRAIIHQAFGNVQHQGRYPLRVHSHVIYLRDIQDLKKKLQRSVEEENYEKAAKLRDRIEELKNLQSLKR